jgi:hypothetical protein
MLVLGQLMLSGIELNDEPWFDQVVPPLVVASTTPMAVPPIGAAAIQQVVALAQLTLLRLKRPGNVAF